MQSLARRIRRARRRDRGAVSIFVAVLLVPVFLAVSALAIDGGSLYFGRQEAQNAADAGALALAQACASGDEAHCVEDVEGSGLTPLVEANVEFGTGSLSAPPCIQEGDGSCSVADLNSLAQCPYPLDSSANGVQVRTENRLNLTLSHIWGADPSAPGACASAVWGPVGSLDAILPITFSACEWSEATGGNPYDPNSGTYPPAPPYPPYPSGFEQTIYLQNKSPSPQGCTTFNGHDSPGGFGWVDGGTSTCGAQVTNGSWIHVDTGNNVPSKCHDLFENQKTATKPIVYLPIYDCMQKTDPGVPPAPSWDCKQGNGNNAYYHVVGYAKFYLSGWYLSGSSKASPNLGVPCSGGNRCLSGYFLKGLVDEAEISTDPTVPSFGLSVVKMAG